MADILERLQPIFRDVFDDDRLVITRASRSISRSTRPRMPFTPSF